MANGKWQTQLANGKAEPCHVPFAIFHDQRSYAVACFEPLPAAGFAGAFLRLATV